MRSVETRFLRQAVSPLLLSKLLTLRVHGVMLDFNERAEVFERCAQIEDSEFQGALVRHVRYRYRACINPEQ
jgi:hypothetical protein